MKLEYERDKAKGMNPEVPYNYFPDDDPTKEPVVNWRSAGQLLWTNWINYYFTRLRHMTLRKLKTSKSININNWLIK